MKIREIEVFDIFGDGTLAIKTNVDDPIDDLRYAWYISKEQQLLYKSNYQRKPYTGYKADLPGTYVIKAFVRISAQDRMEQVVRFTVNKTTSPLLAGQFEPLEITPMIEHVSGPFWKVWLRGDFAKETEFAWYVYAENKDEPLFRTDYSHKGECIYKFNHPGTYRIKAFVRQDGQKYSRFSPWFKVE